MHFYQQKGIAAIELTIMLPVLLLFVYAIAEFSRVLYQYNMLTQLTRDATRYISLAGNATSDTTGYIDLTSPLGLALKVKTKNLLVYGKTTGGVTPLLSGLTTADISIDVLPAPNDSIIVISVDYNWTPILGDTMPTFGLGNDIDLSFNLKNAYAMRAL